MGGALSRVTVDTIAKNLARPENTFSGHLIGIFLRRRNADVEKLAVKQCKIQPNYQVLEVGFGPGIGLQEAYKHVKDGSGVIHGVEISDKMIREASSYLKKEISTGKVFLYPNSVTDLPLENNSIDCIFHCNCYYFWSDKDAAAKELYRVMKPDGVIIAVRNVAFVQKAYDKGFIKYGNPDPKLYMDSLIRNGFINVKDEPVPTRKLDVIINVISATAEKIK